MTSFQLHLKDAVQVAIKEDAKRCASVLAFKESLLLLFFFNVFLLGGSLFQRKRVWTILLYICILK